MAATLGDGNITFGDGTTMSSFNSVLQRVFQISTFGSLNVGASVGVTATPTTSYGWGAGSVYLWHSLVGGIAGRGTYYSDLTLSGGTTITQYTTSYVITSILPNPTVKNLFSSATGTGTSMVVTVYCELYVGTDDSIGYRITYADNGGTEQTLLATTTAGGGLRPLVIYNANVTVPVNTTRVFKVYGSVLGGSSTDGLQVKQFTVSFHSWTG
jgi:hypothetical protein